MNLEDILFQSPLINYVKKSGKHPISLQGHYDHWLKYNGKRTCSTIMEHSIKKHLQTLRLDRHLTQIKPKKIKDKPLSYKKLGIGSRKSTGKSLKGGSNIFTLYNDIIESGSTWWQNSPLPDIATENDQKNETEIELDLPFYRTTLTEKRFDCLKQINGNVSTDILNEYYNSRTLHIYIASTNCDMTEEMSKLELSVWPYLRELCLQYNKTLIIHNLHIFSAELIALGMDQYRKEIIRSINICKDQKSCHMKALIFIGDEFDKKDPPTYLHERDFISMQIRMKPDLEKISNLQAYVQTLKHRQQHNKSMTRNTESKLEINKNEDSGDSKIGHSSMRNENEKINQEVLNLSNEIEKLSFQTNIKLIEQWYQKVASTNDLYKLSPESDIIKDLKSSDLSKRKQARATMENIRNQICFILSTYSLDTMPQQKTILEQEIELLDSIITENKCILVSRTFTNKSMEEQVKNQRDLLLKKICKTNQIRYELELHESNKLAVKELRNHASYIDQVTANISDVLKESIITGIEHEDNEFMKLKQIMLIDTMDEKDQSLLFDELSLQLKVLKERMCCYEDLFDEMKDFLMEIEKHVSGDGQVSLITSTSISGKTNIICHFISKLHEKQLENDSLADMIIYRILGTSFQNTDITKLLRSICSQLLYETEMKLSVPHDLFSLQILLCQILESVNFRILLIIDGMDHLKELKAESFSLLSWLPIHHKNVSIVLSADKDCPAYQCFINFMKLHEKNPSVFHLPELSDKSIELLISSFATTHNLMWTDDQRENLIANINTCKSVGFVFSNLKLAQIWTLKSSIPKLGNKLDQNILYYFAKLEDQFGEPIIRRLLGYITSFKSGVSLTEIVDIMAFDEAVQKFVKTSIGSSNSVDYAYTLLRCVFTELGHTLGSFFDESGLELIKWLHTSYGKAATSRYLLQKDKAPSYHQTVSQYFMNDESDIEILSKSMENESDMPNYPSYLIKQNTIFNLRSGDKRIRLNHRKNLQFPYHLMQLQNQKLLKNLCLFNFYWLQATVIDYGLTHVITVLKSAFEMEPEDTEYPVLIELLHLSLPTVNYDPFQLGSQILGRITDIIRSDRQTREVRKYVNLDELYKSIPKNNFHSVFVPSKSCMRTPGLISGTVIGSCFGKVTCILANETCTRLYVSSDIGVLYIWDISMNTIFSITMGIGKNVFQMVLNQDNTKLIMALPEVIEVWNIIDKVMLIQLDILYDLYYLTISSDKSLFSAIYYGTSWMATWDFESLNLLLTTQLSIDTSVNNKGEIICSNACNKFLSLMAVKYDNKAVLVDIRNGEINPKPLFCKVKGAAITNLDISLSYYVLCNRGLSITDLSSLVYYIDLIGIETLQNIRRIFGCALDCVKSLAINSVGSHAITMNNNSNSNVSDISVWNLETEEHKHCCEMEGIVDLCEAKDFARIYVSSGKSREVLKFNIQNALQSAKSKGVTNRSNYTLRTYEMNDQYVFLMNASNSLIEIYNMMRNKKAGKKTWSIISIADHNDIVLPFKSKLIILSDKNYSPIVPDCKNVYQMIKIFDLTIGRVVSQTKEVFIYPCRKNEFIVLNDDLLIGLSDNRSHIVSWNLSAGQIQWRIRPNNSVLSIGRPHSFKEESINNDITHSNRSFIKPSIHDLVIDSILVSDDLSTLIVAYFSPFLCVFSLIDQCHSGTLHGDFSLLDLQVAAITANGSYLIQNNFNDKHASASLSLWNTKSENPVDSIQVANNILTVALNNNGNIVIYIEMNSGVFIWRIDFRSLIKLPQSQNILLTKEQECRLEILQDDNILLLYNGYSFQMWNIGNGENEFICQFQPDQYIHSYTMCLNDKLLAFTLKGSNEVYTLKLLGKHQVKINHPKTYEKYLEKTGTDSMSSSEEEEE